jgi:hypothetical protein
LIDAGSNRQLDKKLQDALSSTGNTEVNLFNIKNIKGIRAAKAKAKDYAAGKVVISGAVPEKAIGANALSHTSRYVFDPL